MTGPVGALPRNVAGELENALDDPSGWDWFKERFAPAAVADSLRPGDDVMEGLARWGHTELGQKILAWLHDISDGAPYPVGHTTIEQAALASARHEGRAGVGHLIEKAVREGNRLINLKQQRPQS